MKKLISAAICALLSTYSYAATMYVSPSGSNTSPYDTWAKAANLPSTAKTYGDGVAGPHTMYIAPNAYSDYLNITNANWASGTIQGTAAHGSTALAAPGQVSLASSSYHLLRANASGLTVKGVRLKDSLSATYDLVYVDGANFTGEDLWLSDGGRHCINVQGGTAAQFTRCNIEGVDPSGTEGVIMQVGGYGTFDYCRMGNSPANFASGTGASNYAVFRNASNSVTTTLNNCLLHGAWARTVNQTGTGTTTLNNSIIVGGDGTLTLTPLERSAGTLTTNNCMTICNWRKPGVEATGTVTRNNPTDDNQPYFVLRQRQAFIPIRVDDSANYAYAKALGDKLAARGLTGTWYVDTDALTGAALAQAQQFVSDGKMEVGHHSKTHIDLAGQSDATLTTEIVTAKATLESAIGTTVYTFATPYGSTDANVEAKAVTAGFWATTSIVTAADAEWRLSSIDLHQMSYVGSGSLLGASDEETRGRIRAICETLAQTGGVLSFLGHTTGEITMQQWDVILDTIAEYPEIFVGSVYEVVNEIKNGGSWSTADSRTYTRTWTDVSDYRIKVGSPCINAGVDKCSVLSSDFADTNGTKICIGGEIAVGTPDIGMLEFVWEDFYKPRHGNIYRRWAGPIFPQ